jgi:hypothetical protein
VALRLGDHRLDQAAVGLLDLSAATELGLGLAQAEDEGVTNPLELAGIEDPRAADGPHAPLDPVAGEGRREELAEPALEDRDLPAEVVACEPLRRDRDRRSTAR